MFFVVFFLNIFAHKTTVNNTKVVFGSIEDNGEKN